MCLIARAFAVDAVAFAIIATEDGVVLAEIVVGDFETHLVVAVPLEADEDFWLASKHGFADECFAEYVELVPQIFAVGIETVVDAAVESGFEAVPVAEFDQLVAAAGATVADCYAAVAVAVVAFVGSVHEGHQR